jgi:hypothetical protein
MEILVAIDRLDDRVTNQTRIEAERLRADVAAIRAEADMILGTDRAGRAGEVYAAVERLEAIAGAGTGKVRVKRDDVYEQLDTLRQVFPELLATRVEPRQPSPWDPVIDAVDTIQTLMSQARRTPFTGKLKLDSQELRQAAARVRTVATQNIGPPDHRTAPFYAAVDDLEALAADRIPADALWDRLERLYLAMDRAVS